MWRDLRSAAVLSVALLVLPGAASGDESSIVLTAGPGVEQVNAYCAICHSLDYIQMNSPFQDTAGWEKTVTKMVKVMAAPITPEDSATIVAYLATHYGKDSPPPATQP